MWKLSKSDRATQSVQRLLENDADKLAQSQGTTNFQCVKKSIICEAQKWLAIKQGTSAGDLSNNDNESS